MILGLNCFEFGNGKEEGPPPGKEEGPPPFRFLFNRLANFYLKYI